MMWKIATDKTNFILFRQHTRFKRNTLQCQLFGLHENLQFNYIFGVQVISSTVELLLSICPVQCRGHDE
jgi:hypothetical protein